MIVGVLRLQYHVLARYASHSLHIVIHLIVQAALQLGAHTCELGGVQADFLNARGIGAHAGEILHPRGTAQLPSARSCTANAAGLLPGTYLLHLYAHMESGRKVFDELSEVYPFVGYIIEDGLVAVALILHVAYLHLQAQALGYLPRAYHGVVLTGLGLLIFGHVHILGLAVDALNVVGALQISLFQLQLHQLSRQRNHADVVPRTSLHGHDVAFLQVQMVHVMIVALAGILELHLNQVGRFAVSRHVGQPVVCVELSVLPAASLCRETAAAALPKGELHIFKIHFLLSVIRPQSPGEWPDNIYVLKNSLAQQQHNELQRHVEEHHGGVGVLSDVTIGTLQQVVDAYDVALVDERSEVACKAFLLYCHVHELPFMEVVDKALTNHLHEVGQHAALLLTSEL